MKNPTPFVLLQEETQEPNLLRAVFSHACNAMLIADDEGTIIEANAGAENLIASSLTGSSLSKVVRLLHPDDTPVQWPQLLEQSAASGIAIVLGKVEDSHVKYSSTHNILPGRHLFSFTRLPYASKNAKHKRKEEEILDRISDCFFAVDLRWMVTYWNKAAEEVMQKPALEVIGKNLWTVYPESLNHCFLEHYKKALQEQEVVRFEEYYTPAKKWFDVTAYPSEEGLSIFFKDITWQKNKNCELVKTRNNYISLINASRDTIWSVDKDMNLVTANAAYKNAIYDYTGIIPQEGQSVIIPQFGEAMCDKWRGYFASALQGESLQLEEEYILPVIKNSHCLEITIDPIKDQYGEITGVACNARNISERKEAEKLVQQQTKKLQESGKYVENILRDLKKIMDSSLDVICTTDMQGRFLQVSAAAQTVWGYSPAELVGKNYRDFVHPEDQERSREEAFKVKNGNATKNFENRYVKKDGTVVPLIWSSKWDEKQQTIVSVAKDITTLKEAEKIKAESEMRFTALVENSNDIITIISPEFVYLYESPSCKKLTGYYAQQKMGMNSLAYLHPDDEKAVLKAMKGLQQDGQVTAMLYRLKHANGDWRWIEATVSRHFDNPAIKGYVLNKRDITDRKITAQLIEEKNKELKDRENRLSEISSRLQKIMDSSVDIICSFDKDGNFIQVNKACEIIWGYQPSELAGKHYNLILDKAHWESTQQAATNRINGKPTRNFENIYIHKDGRKINMLWSASWDEVENVMYCVGKDITQFKAAEKLKTDTERKFTSLIQNVGDVISILDEKGNHLFVSPSVKEILGYEQEELVKKNVFDLIHPDDLEIALAALQKVLDFSGDFNKLTIRYKNKANEWRYMEVVGTNLLHDEAVNGIVINSRDITDRKMYEVELRTANERFEMALNATNEVIYDWDLQTGKLFWNKNFGKVFGYAEILQEENLEFWKSHIHPDDRTAVLCSLEKILADKSARVWQEEYRFIKADGTVANVLEQGYIIYNDEEKPVRFVGSLRDTTLAKKREAEREQIIDELTKINDDLKQFSYITSHNLRAPLSNIIGILNIFEKEQLDNNNRNLLEMIGASASQLNSTLDDLSKVLIIRNNHNGHHQQLNIVQLLEEVKQSYNHSLHDAGATVHQHLEVEDFTFNAIYFKSIISNLFSNAIKYRSPHRPLQITIATTKNNNNEIEFSFSDNGIGFNYAMHKDRVCGLYQRFHDHTEGKGLGLFIVKSQVNSMGGRLIVDSNEDEGTSFTISLKY